MLVDVQTPLLLAFVPVALQLQLARHDSPPVAIVKRPGDDQVAVLVQVQVILRGVLIVVPGAREAWPQIGAQLVKCGRAELSLAFNAEVLRQGDEAGGYSRRKVVCTFKAHELTS